jgi:hypothetical protein
VLGGRAAHERALGGVAVAARAEHDVQAAARDLARGAQHVVERVRRVRVVDQHGEPLALVDRLEAPGHAVRASERAHDRLHRHVERPRRRDRRQCVLHVEQARQAGRDLELAVGRRTREARTARVEAHVEGAVVGVRVDGIGGRRDVELAGQPLPVRVVDVDDRRSASLREQALLGGVVVLHRRMEVQVVLGQVGPDADGEVDARRAPELERVRGDLHRHGSVAFRQHPREKCLQIDRFRRRPLDRFLRAADDRRDRAEQPGLDPGGLEQLADQERRRRLAVRAGDADDAQRGCRVAVKARGGGAHRGAHVVDHDLGNAEVERALDDQRGGAAGNRVGSEVVPVGLEARDTEKERPRSDARARVGQAGDLDLRGAIPHQIAEIHGRRMLPRGSEGERGAQSGGMPRYGSANDTIFSNAGAATTPP